MILVDIALKGLSIEEQYFTVIIEHSLVDRKQILKSKRCGIVYPVSLFVCRFYSLHHSYS